MEPDRKTVYLMSGQSHDNILMQKKLEIAGLGSRNKEKDLVNNWPTFATLTFMILFVIVLK